MTYTLTLSVRCGDIRSTHETAEQAQAEAIWMHGPEGFVRAIVLVGPVGTVAIDRPTRSDMHHLADRMEWTESQPWGCNA